MRSSFISVTGRPISGVPQVVVNSSTGVVFSLFINHVCDIFGDMNVVCKLYAEDLKLCTTYSSLR